MILMIDNYDSFVYNLYQGVAQPDLPVKVVRNDKISLQEIAALHPLGIILSPGPGRPENAGICIPLIQQFSGKVPIFGVCLGHQAIAMAFGGRVIAAQQIVHGKAYPVCHYQRGLYQSMPVPFMAARYHSLMVDKESFPEDLMIEARSVGDVIMAIRHRHHLTFGVQFHPESILTPQGGIILKEFVHVARNFSASREAVLC
ncbi:MAG: aminodeoxychorismate/anthranilate synthase component II [Gammaproteobacteria bacterium]